MTAAAPIPDLLSEDTRQYFAKVPKHEMYLEEAEFGLRQILPVLEQLPAGARVLEVGSGPCLALSHITDHFPHLHVEGIEPMGDGFAFFDDFIARLQAKSPNFAVHKGGYETFPDGPPWDLIFLVNVFEHLPDWRDFLGFLSARLAPGGQAIVLCPNYGFPYESHFRIPILWNKALTRKAFATKIETFETEGGFEGLYHSLNFVKLSEVRQAVRHHDLTLNVHTEIIRDMVNRLETDPAFAERQKALAGGARLLKRTGLLDWMLRQPLFQNRLPYMKLSFGKPG